jgi:hypothetical protein
VLLREFHELIDLKRAVLLREFQELIDLQRALQCTRLADWFVRSRNDREITIANPMTAGFTNNSVSSVVFLTI